MKKNVGTIDMAIRLLIAALVIVLFFTNVISGTLAIVLLVVAGLMILTGIVGICPLYMVLKVSTRSRKQVKE